MPHFVTLGYAENPVLDHYREKFLEKVTFFWKKYISDDIPSSDFLLFPDYHGALFDMTKEENTPDIQKLRDFLIREYERFQLQLACLGRLPSEVIIPGTKIALTTSFYNPYVDADHVHPDHKKHQIHSGFGSKSFEEWQSLFAKTFDILSRTSPGFQSEVSSLICKIIPYDVSYQVHNSASYGTFIGHLLMSYPTGMDHTELALLEAIIHEYNHNKLNLILQTTDLLRNDRSERYYSPYRPDARHIHGIYLGLHALTGAYWAILHAHLRSVILLPDNWIDKAVLYILKNGLAIQVLEKYAQFTPLGQNIFDEMIAVHQECLQGVRALGLSRDRMSRIQSELQGHYLEAKRTNTVLFS